MRANLMLANRINSITIHNFRSLADVTVDMEDLTVLVGANGTGKSNFLKALDFVRDVIRLGPIETFYMHDNGNVNHNANEVSDVEFEIRLTINGQDALYSLAFGVEPTTGRAVRHEIAKVGEYKYDTTENPVTIYGPSLENDKFTLTDRRHVLLLRLATIYPPLTPFVPLLNFLTNLRVYSIFPDALRAPKQPGQPHALLEEDGQNLPTLLQDFVSNVNSKKKQDFYDELARIVPGIDLLDPLMFTDLLGYLLVLIKHSDSRGTLALSSESDGTLRALARLLALNQTPGPSIIGIEEPELMLHPEAMGVLADVIREASFRSQVILTTHSPDLITNFPFNSLPIVDLENGDTKIGPVREDQRQIVEESLFGSGNLLRLGGLARE